MTARTVIAAAVPRAVITRTAMIVMTPAHVLPSAVAPRMPAAISVIVAATIVVVGATEAALIDGPAHKVRAVSKSGIVSSSRLMRIAGGSAVTKRGVAIGRSAPLE